MAEEKEPKQQKLNQSFTSEFGLELHSILTQPWPQQPTSDLPPDVPLPLTASASVPAVPPPVCSASANIASTTPTASGNPHLVASTPFGAFVPNSAGSAVFPLSLSFLTQSFMPSGFPPSFGTQPHPSAMNSPSSSSLRHSSTFQGLPQPIRTMQRPAAGVPAPFDAAVETARHQSIELWLVSQMDPAVILVKKQPVDYVLHITGLTRANESSVQVTPSCFFWADTSKQWELRNDAGDVTVNRAWEADILKVTVTMRYQKTSKMLPVFVRFVATGGPLAANALTVDSAKLVLIGREDLQKTRGAGVLFWMRVCGGITSETWKSKQSWSAIEPLLCAHFAKELSYEGRQFDARELQYMRERTKFPLSQEQYSRETFLQVFWPWFYPVELNIRKYSDLWNCGLIHGFYQTAEVEHMIRGTPPGTFILRFCSNSQFDPAGAMALTVSKGGAEVQHILLTAEALENESLYKLLARYTDCVCFYPNIPKMNVEQVRKEMAEIGVGNAHYKDVGFTTMNPAPPSSSSAEQPAPAAVTTPIQRNLSGSNANAGGTNSGGNTPVAAAGTSNPLKRLALDGSDDAPSRAKRPLSDESATAAAAAAAASSSFVPSHVVVHYTDPDTSLEHEQRVHLAAGLTFRQLLPSALKHFRLPETEAAVYAFQDAQHVPFPDAAVVQQQFHGSSASPNLYLVHL